MNTRSPETIRRESEPRAPRHRENLALVFQEVLTAIVRLRSHRHSISNADTFRAQMREALRRAEQEAGNRGYSQEDIRLATFAVVAFLDESILNLRDPIFVDWPRRPMQEEIFGGHVAGEIFFDSLQRLLGRTDSQDLADILEVFNLCILLGYRGRYGAGGQAELHSISDTTAQKIRRIRKTPTALSPDWAPPDEAIKATGSDPWIRRLVIGAGTCFLIAFLLFISFKVILGSGVSDLQNITMQALK
jgi:type VI secretion system protein ImpK